MSRERDMSHAQAGQNKAYRRAGERITESGVKWITNLQVQEAFGNHAFFAFRWLNHNGWTQHYVGSYKVWRPAKVDYKPVTGYASPGLPPEEITALVRAEREMLDRRETVIADIPPEPEPVFEPHFINIICRRMALVNQALWARRTA